VLASASAQGVALGYGLFAPLGLPTNTMDIPSAGHTVGLAQRMEALASPDSCYLTQATAARVSSYFDLQALGAFSVKGASAPVDVFQLRGAGAVRTRFDVSRSRGLSRFVGRAADLRMLEDAIARRSACSVRMTCAAGHRGRSACIDGFKVLSDRG